MEEMIKGAAAALSISEEQVIQKANASPLSPDLWLRVVNLKRSEPSLYETDSIRNKGFDVWYAKFIQTPR